MSTSWLLTLLVLCTHSLSLGGCVTTPFTSQRYLSVFIVALFVFDVFVAVNKPPQKRYPLVTSIKQCRIIPTAELCFSFLMVSLMALAEQSDYEYAALVFSVLNLVNCLYK